MSQKELNLELIDEYTDVRWKTLYKIAGVAAVITAAIIPISIGLVLGSALAGQIVKSPASSQG